MHKINLVLDVRKLSTWGLRKSNRILSHFNSKEEFIPKTL